MMYCRGEMVAIVGNSHTQQPVAEFYAYSQCVPAVPHAKRLDFALEGRQLLGG